MRSSVAAVLVASLVALVPAAAAHAETVERIVAVVDDRPVLLSELRAHEAVAGLPEDKALEAAIDERLMNAEASRIPQAEVTPEEETKALAQLVETRPTLRGGVSEPELRRLVHRQLAILKYVEFRFRPQLRVSDEDVRQAWREEQAGRPTGAAFEDEQDAIRTRLERRALDERVEAWVKELRARADVRYVTAPPGREARAP